MQRPGFLGQEDPPDKGMAAHSSILAWRITWTEEPGGLQFLGLQRVRHDWETNTLTFKHKNKQQGPTVTAQGTILSHFLTTYKGI